MTDARLAEAYLEVLSQAPSSAQLAEAYLEAMSTNSDYHRVVMADSPGHLYMLNEATGTTLLDSSGNGRHGTYSGGLPPTAADLPVSAPGRGKVFTQYAQWAQAANSAYYSTAAYTIEGVVQCSVTTDTIFFYSFDSFDPFTISVSNTTVTLASRLSTLAQTSVTYSVNLLDGNPHHVAGTWDGTTMYLYIDGVQRGSAAMSGTLRNPSGQAIYLARSSTGNTARSFGAIAYYPTALSAARIKAHSAAALTGVFLAGTTTETTGTGSRTVTLTQTPRSTDALLLIYSGGNTFPGMSVSGQATWGTPVGTSNTTVSQFFALGTAPTGSAGSTITVTDTAGSARLGSLYVYIVRGMTSPTLGTPTTSSTFGVTIAGTAQAADVGSVVFAAGRGKNTQMWPSGSPNGDWHPTQIGATSIDQSGYAVSLAPSSSHSTSLAVPSPSTSISVSQVVLSPGSGTASAAAALTAPSTLSASAGANTLSGAAALTAPSTLTASAGVTELAAAALTAPSSLTANAVVAKAAAANLTAPSVLTVNALVTELAAASLTAPSVLVSAASSGSVTVSAAATLLAPSTLLADALVTELAAAALLAPSTLSVSAAATLLPTAALTAPSVLAASATRTTLGAVAMLAGSSLTADGTLVLSGAVAMMTASSVLAVAQVQVAVLVWNGTVLVAGRIWVWDGSALVDPVTRKAWDGSALV